MSSDAFGVTTTTKSVPLTGQHTITFTVTNQLDRQVRVNGYVELFKDGKELEGIDWIAVVPPETFDLAPDGTAQVSVRIDVPPTLPSDWEAEKTSLQFQLMVRNIDNPDKENGASVPITLHPDGGQPPPPPVPPNKLWMILAMVGGGVIVLGIIGLVIFLVTRDGSKPVPEPQDAAVPRDTAPPDVGPPPPQTVTVTVTQRAFGGGSGSVRSFPQGISCNGGDCNGTLSVLPGTEVTLLATPAAGSQFYWSGGCSGTGASCTITPTAAVKVTGTFNATNYVFVTAERHNGNWGGNLADVDTFCNQQASQAGLPGNYVAWISNSSTSAKSRLGTARGWIRLDGLPFADSVATMTADRKVYYPVAYDSLGRPTSTTAMTGTKEDGTPDSSNCAGWTTTSGVQMTGGSASKGAGGWSTGVGTLCDATMNWYCFGTSLNRVVTVTAESGRMVFLSTPWPPRGGIAGADAHCQSNASAAGLANASSFRAFLSTTTITAASRVNLSGQPWVRPDGVRVVKDPADLVAEKLIAPIAVEASGTSYAPQFGLAWTGAESPTKTATIDDSCGDWTNSSTSQRGRWGVAANTDTGFFGWNNLITTCASPEVRVYCLEP